MEGREQRTGSVNFKGNVSTFSQERSFLNPTLFGENIFCTMIIAICSRDTEKFELVLE